jgi:hypothetical protein
LDGREEPLAIAALPSDGRFTFAGLAPGSYTLSRFRADEGAPGVPLATVEVEAGRTTWIDLARAERRVRFLGRVVDAKGPVSGVRVRIHPESFTTDREGRFEMRSSFPLAGRVSVQVRRDPVETWYSFQGMSPETTSFEKEFVLGNASVIVRTVDESGSPAAARLDLALAGLGGAVSDVESLRFQPVFVDESGERRVDGLLAGDYTIRARFDNGAECVQAVAVDDAAEIVMQRPPSGDLEVRVRETDNQPAVGRWISVQVAEEDRGRSGDAVPGPGLPMRWCETDVDGLATFRGVGAGTIVVQVRARRGERSGLDSLLAEETAALAAGETKRIEVDLSAR